MPKIIEHGGGASTGAAAFGAGVAGFGEGFVQGSELMMQQERTRATVRALAEREKASKADRQLMEEAAELERSQREAATGMRRLGNAKLAAPMSDLKGVAVPWEPPSEEEMRMSEGLSDRDYQLWRGDIENSRQTAIFKANVIHLRGTLERLASGEDLPQAAGQEGQAGAEGGEMAEPEDPELEALLGEAETAVAAYENGEATAREVQAILGKVSDYQLEKIFGADDRMELAALFQGARQRAQTSGPAGMVNDSELEWIETIWKEQRRGELSGAEVRVLLGSTKEDAGIFARNIEARARDATREELIAQGWTPPVNSDTTGELLITNPGENTPRNLGAGGAPGNGRAPIESAFAGKPLEQRIDIAKDLQRLMEAGDTAALQEYLDENNLDPSDPALGAELKGITDREDAPQSHAPTPNVESGGGGGRGRGVFEATRQPAPTGKGPASLRAFAKSQEKKKKAKDLKEEGLREGLQMIVEAKEKKSEKPPKRYLDAAMAKVRFDDRRNKGKAKLTKEEMAEKAYELALRNWRKAK